MEDLEATGELGTVEPSKRSSKNQASLTFEKGLRILGCFDIDHPEWSLKDICAHTGVARPTAYRLLRTLLDARFLTRNQQSSGYRLGSALLQTAYLMFSSVEIGRIAHPFLEELVAETNESAVLGVWRDGDALLIDVAVADHPFVLASTVGSVIPGYSTIHGKLFLAFGRKPSDPPFSWEKIERRTEYTITDPQELEKELLQARQEGVVFNLQEWRRGMCAVGAPVFGPNGALAATLGVVAPNERFGPAEMRYCAAAAKRTAARISDTLGYRDQL